MYSITKKTVSLIILVTFMFSLVSPGELIDYKIRQDKEGDEAIIYEELLFDDLNRTIVQEIAPDSLINITINGEKVDIRSSVINESVNVMELKYISDNFDRKQRESLLSEHLIEMEQNRDKEKNTIKRKILSSPGILIILITEILYSRLVNLNQSSSGVEKLSQSLLNPFTISIIYELIRIIVWENSETNTNNSIKNIFTGIKGSNQKEESLVAQYKKGYTSALERARIMKNKEYKYILPPNNSMIILKIINIILPIFIFPIFTLSSPLMVNIQWDLPQLSIYYGISIAVIIADMIGYRVYSQYGRRKKSNEEKMVIQLPKMITEIESRSRSYLYGYHKAIQNILVE